ncbi:fibulin-1-like [Odontesthes bonariensis]
MAANVRSSCEVPGLTLGKQCSDTAKTCCEQPEEVQPTAEVWTEEPEVVPAHPPEGNNTCRDSKCTQLCLGNDMCACHEGFQLKTDGVTCEDVNECLHGSHNCTPGQVCLNTDGSFGCQSSCGTGFILGDTKVCRDIDECALGTHNCGVDFVCTNTAGSFSCHPKKACGDGYIQDAAGSCIDLNECEAQPGPCQPGWTCVNTVGSYNCHSNTIDCAQGYNSTVDGTHCEDVNECLTGVHNCVHGQVCLNTAGSFYCQSSCGTGFILSDNICEDIDECALGTHHCQADSVCTNTAGSFHCQQKAGCGDGYIQAATGSCVDVDECLLGKVCGRHVCVNLAGSHRCECHSGFVFSSITKLCEDIDECRHYSRRPCAHRCENTEGSYRCSCITGFKLAHDGRNCEDVNECLNGSHTCAPGQVCSNTEGSFECQRESSCGTGYKLTDNNSCQDMDECALGTHECGADFVCINTAGSYRCVTEEGCGDGFIENAASSCIGKLGFAHANVNECVAHPSPCQSGQTCINTIGSYNCRSNTVTCGRGYHLAVDGTHCEDVNECLLGNVCVGHGCVNSEGSYLCKCRPGYTFHLVTKLCEDVNECRQYPGRLCAHKCENTKGSYFCSCASGFKLAPDGRNCEDVNECELSPCSQECANVYGSYQCYCHRGYQLSDIDGITCEDIDECALPNVCSYRCLNTPGGFNCTCPPSGFTLAHDGRKCQDIDECAAGTHTCSASESCFNVQGGFRCLFFECPPNFRRAVRGSGADASVIVRCLKACQRQDTDCLHNPVHIITSTVLSLPTLKSFKEPEEIVFLRTAAAAKAVPLPDDPDVYFEIVATDDQFSFDVVKRSHHGMIVGVIRQLKPIIGPRELVLEVTMNYVQSGFISQKNIVIIHVFISEFWF